MKPHSISVNIDKNNNLDSIKLTYVIQHGDEIEGFYTKHYKRLSEGTCGLKEFESDINGNPLSCSSIESIKPKFRDYDEMYTLLNKNINQYFFSAALSKNGKNLETFSYSDFSKPLALIEGILTEKIDLTKHFPGLKIEEESKSDTLKNLKYRF
jgi:hypothetical protein